MDVHFCFFILFISSGILSILYDHQLVIPLTVISYVERVIFSRLTSVLPGFTTSTYRPYHSYNA